MNEMILLQKLTDLENQIKELKKLTEKQDKEMKWAFDKVYEYLTNPYYGLEALSKK